MKELEKEVSYIDGLVYIIGLVLAFSFAVYITSIIAGSNKNNNTKISDRQTRKILGVLYIILFMVFAICGITFVRTVYGDVGNTMMKDIITALVVIIGFSMFAQL